MPVPNSNKVILTRIANSVQVHQSHSVICSTSNAREHTLDNVDIGGSDFEVACDEFCSHCNVRHFENFYKGNCHM